MLGNDVPYFNDRVGLPFNDDDGPSLSVVDKGEAWRRVIRGDSIIRLVVGPSNDAIHDGRIEYEGKSENGRLSRRPSERKCTKHGRTRRTWKAATAGPLSERVEVGHSEASV